MSGKKKRFLYNLQNKNKQKKKILNILKEVGFPGFAV